ncbi:adenosine deaminase [Atlantibacter hermannii]|uniref:adenosine deaminase n=1 Tax=Atlantibacter hermannii TaxID=565 RepID=UPI00290E78E3|nr:adenosine deaminase [Atlantibacter hermannii]MDU7391133.1 adenosine deaminase [Atlantibacter hermannii]
MDDFSVAPKGELHVHFNGALPPRVVDRIIVESNSAERLAEINYNCSKLLVNKTSPNLVEYLKPWEFLRLIPINKEQLYILIEAFFIAMSDTNIKFVEVRHTVVHLAKNCDITYLEALDWLLEGLLIYGGKYNIKVGLIITIGRGEQAIDHIKSAITNIPLSNLRNLIIGIDLAGDEDYKLENDIYYLFKKCKYDFGLGITIHAGETGNINNIKEAVTLFDADRIGHGTCAKNDFKVLEMLSKNKVCVEVCPLSNMMTGATRLANGHSLKEFLKFEVPFVICSDNPGIQETSLNEDYIYCNKEVDMPDFLRQMYEYQKQFTFIKGIL